MPSLDSPTKLHPHLSWDTAQNTNARSGMSVKALDAPPIAAGLVPYNKSDPVHSSCLAIGVVLDSR